jgi:hypothetical protein
VRKLYGIVFLILISAAAPRSAAAQATRSEAAEFGPVVRAYLGYLRNEQEVVDDRNSRHEISASYYRRNLNRIRALRQTAVRLARESGNDYLPELEAVTADELRSLFENPPRPATLRAGKVFSNTFRFLGTVRAGDTFYVFARLDPYEQAELMQREKSKASGDSQMSTPDGNGEDGQAQTRARRATAP